MTRKEPARTTTRRTAGVLVTGLLFAGAAATAALAHQSPASPSPAIESPAARPPGVLRSEHRGVLDEADGVVPGGTTVFQDEVPGVGQLDPALLSALRQAVTDAAGVGVEFHVTSGWRSPRYQDQLLRQAVEEHGSAEEAARWVATPETSAHVSGEAVDIGPADATAWLSENGADHGLCQVYRNEPWHYELRPEAVDDGCPPMYADPTQDPRMRQ